jgi:hypothetical protein
VEAVPGHHRLVATHDDSPWAAARAEHGDAVTACHLARTPAQRRHDALVELAERAVTAPADGKRPQPLISAFVGYETFKGRICELARGSVVTPARPRPSWTRR